MYEITRSILFLAKQNIAVRGQNERQDSLNRGIYLEFLNLKKSNVSILNENVSCSYIDPKYQIEIIELNATHIKNDIVKECKGKPFSIIIDETTVI